MLQYLLRDMRLDRDKRYIMARTRDYTKDIYHDFTDCSKAFEPVKAIVFSIIKYNSESCRLREKKTREKRQMYLSYGFGDNYYPERRSNQSVLSHRKINCFVERMISKQKLTP